MKRSFRKYASNDKVEAWKCQREAQNLHLSEDFGETLGDFLGIEGA